MESRKNQINSAYRYCQNIAQNHYENFPVASILLKKELRAPISAVYAFARTADDFADEGNLSGEQRLKQLDEFSDELKAIESCLVHNGKSNSNNLIFIALLDVIKKYQIPISLFHDLLYAFKQDVHKNRYQTFDEVLDYCHYSATPVGRILLYLNHSATKDNMKASDAICMGLQLINFYQDIHQDICENNRLYLPIAEMNQFGVTIDVLEDRINNRATRKLMKHQIKRCRQLYESGYPLCSRLSGRFALEIRTIYAGGLIILNKLENNLDSIYARPRLGKMDKLKIIWRGLFPLQSQHS